MTEYLKLDAPPVDKREIMRYAKSLGDEENASIINECIDKSGGVLNYNIAFCELNFTINGGVCDFGAFSVSSHSLSKNLSEAKRVFLFVASVGHGIDRLINKYSRTSPHKALFYNAIGTERVEALADSFVKWLEDKTSLKAMPRFSAGYGDLPLSIQKDIFEFLKPEKQAGVFLSDNFIMSPSKSVTAFLGLK